MIRIALAKGFLFDEALSAFRKAGFKLPKREAIRELTFFDSTKQFEFLIVRPMDVPVYVEYGVAHLGVVGKDVLGEQTFKVAECLDLTFGRCDLVLAVLEDAGIAQASDLPPYSRVATKFPNQADRFFHQYGMTVELIKLYGSVELAPRLGLATAVVDLTATGKTLKQNGLKAIATLLHSTARLIANPVFTKTDYPALNQLVQRLSLVVS